MILKYKPLLFFVFILFISLSWSQTNAPPNIIASGDQAYCPLSQINIVTSFDITDPDDTEIESLSIQISAGYEQGEDQLLLTGTHPNVVSSWNNLEGKLSLTGIGGVNVSYSNLIAAVNDVVFQSNSENVFGEKFFSFTIGDANYLPSTDHYYEYVSDPGVTWSQAKAAAEVRTYFGLQGYLVTITSAEEAQLSGEQAAGTGWIGGSDEEIEGTWKWVTGPEAGDTFWFGQGNGTTFGADSPYANWNSLNNEPNNAKTNGEHYAHIVSPNLVPQGLARLGTWNDLPNEGSTGDFFPQGYIVEYGGMPGDPIVNIAASTQITIPRITSLNEGEVCNGDSLTLNAVASTGNVIWFDAPTGGNLVHTGLTYTTPSLTETTSYYALASVNGCLEGGRTQVTISVKSIPTIASVTNAVICVEGSGTLSANASQGIVSWYDALTGGTLLATGNSFTTPIVTVGTTYYVDATFNGCTTKDRTPVTLTIDKLFGLSNIEIDDIAIVDLTNNNTVTIDTSNIGAGDYEFSLDNEFGPFQNEAFFEKVYSGDHILYVRDKNGCGTVTLALTVLGFPKFFTPNGDSFNPTWNIKGMRNGRFNENSVVSIYDRYGKLIKQITLSSNGWDGTFNGKSLPNSDYWFVAQLINYEGETRILKGHFALKR